MQCIIFPQEELSKTVIEVIYVSTSTETKTPQKNTDLHSQELAKVTEHWLHTLERGERLEQRMLKEMAAKLRAEKANQTK